MSISIIIVLLCALAICLAAYLFTNGVEWLGYKFNMGGRATGALLAAIGTSLPETIVTLVATAFGHSPEEKAIGMGAALAGPLVLGTLAYGFAGFTMLMRNKQYPVNPVISDPDRQMMIKSQSWFLMMALAAAIMGGFTFNHKNLVGILFLFSYFLYANMEARAADSGGKAEQPEHLPFHPKSTTPSMLLVIFQTSLTATVMLALSHYFVQQLVTLSGLAGISPQSIAMFLSPVATEMPEIVSAIIWCRQGKDQLAIGNITGSMMIQTTLPCGFAIIFSPWLFDSKLFYASSIILVSGTLLWLTLFRNRVTSRFLLLLGLLYPIFAIFQMQG